MKKTVVIGGGIAGLCTAYHLIEKGQQIILIEEETIGHKTSSRAAGMITPASEVHLGENTLMDCFLKCAEYYPGFINTLTNSKPELVDFNRTGSLMCATEQDGARDLTRLAEFQRSMGLEVTEVSQEELATMEPLLSHRTTHALFAKGEAYVDNVKLLQLLKNKLLESKKCEILENKKVTRFNFQNDKIDSIQVDSHEPQTITADHYILTTGLSHDIQELNESVCLPLRPVRGQVITVQCQKDTIRRPIRVYHRYPIYLVPREDGKIIIGATSEELSEDCVTAGGIMDLIYAAWQVLPIIYDSPIVETNVGFRPATPDHKPIVGGTKINNLFVFTGLYRHGIMAAPFLASEFIKLIHGEKTKVQLEEFSINRFVGVDCVDPQ